MSAEIFDLRKAGFLRSILREVKNGVPGREQWLPYARKLARSAMPQGAAPPAPVPAPILANRESRPSIALSGFPHGAGHRPTFLALRRDRGLTEIWHWRANEGERLVQSVLGPFSWRRCVEALHSTSWCCLDGHAPSEITAAGCSGVLAELLTLAWCNRATLAKARELTKLSNSQIAALRATFGALNGVRFLREWQAESLTPGAPVADRKNIRILQAGRDLGMFERKNFQPAVVMSSDIVGGVGSAGIRQLAFRRGEWGTEVWGGGDDLEPELRVVLPGNYRWRTWAAWLICLDEERLDTNRPDLINIRGARPWQADVLALAWATEETKTLAVRLVQLSNADLAHLRRIDGPFTTPAFRERLRRLVADLETVQATALSLRTIARDVRQSGGVTLDSLLRYTEALKMREER